MNTSTLIGIVTYEREVYLVNLISKLVKSVDTHIIIFNKSFDNRSKLYSNLSKVVSKNGITAINTEIQGSKSRYLDFNSLSKIIQSLKTKKLAKITLLSNYQNIGGSGGIAAIQYIFRELNSYEYLWMIDDEMEINENTLLNLIKIVRENQKIGIVGSTLLSQDKILEAGSSLSKSDFKFLPRYHGYSLNKFYKAVGKKMYDEVEYVSFASILLTKKCIDRTGVFKNFFIHVDDAEYCLRAREKGLKIAVSYKSFAKTKKVKKSNYSVYDLRNFLFLASEHYPLFNKLLIYSRVLRRLVYSYFYNRKAFRVIIRAYWLFLSRKYGKESEFKNILTLLTVSKS